MRNVNDAKTIIEMLKRRGFGLDLCNPKDYLVFPPDWDPAFEDELYGLLKKYSFRIFIRDVIKNRKSFEAEDLTKYSTREWVERYIRFLVDRGVVDTGTAGTGSRRPLYSASATPSSGSWPTSSGRSSALPRSGA